MAKYDYPSMTEQEVIDEIEDLEEGQAVAFAVADQGRYKLHFTYEVTNVAPDATADFAGPRNGSWRFTIEEGHPKLRFRSPSHGWQSAGVLDYVESRG